MRILHNGTKINTLRAKKNQYFGPRSIKTMQRTPEIMERPPKIYGRIAEETEFLQN